MIFRVERFERSCKRNVKGEVVSRSYGYVIVIWKWKRWWLRKYYLRLLPGWFDCFLKDKIVKVELTRNKNIATDFREDNETSSYFRKSVAENLVAAINRNPNMFVLN